MYTTWKRLFCSVLEDNLKLTFTKTNNKRKYYSLYEFVLHQQGNKCTGLYHVWFGFFCSPAGYISRIDSLRGSLTPSARSYTLQLQLYTHVNKQYIREPHQSWYKSVIHLDLGIYVVKKKSKQHTSLGLCI